MIEYWKKMLSSFQLLSHMNQDRLDYIIVTDNIQISVASTIECYLGFTNSWWAKRLNQLGKGAWQIQPWLLEISSQNWQTSVPLHQSKQVPWSCLNWRRLGSVILPCIRKEENSEYLWTQHFKRGSTGDELLEQCLAHSYVFSFL